MRFIFTILFFASSFIFAQHELNIEAKQLRESAPKLYANLKQNAIDFWEDNHVMVVNHINENAAAFHRISLLIIEHPLIFIDALDLWVRDEDRTELYKLKLQNDVQFYQKVRIDWKMAENYMEQNIRAKNVY